MTGYQQSKVVEQIAERLITDHHVHLETAHIAYMMKLTDDAPAPKPGRMGKHPAAAKARSVPAIYGAITGFDFVLEVDERYWDLLAPAQQEALVDHELCHFRCDEKGWYVADHDVEEFRAVLERHGYWRPSLEEFVNAAPQKELPFAPLKVVVGKR